MNVALRVEADTGTVFRLCLFQLELAQQMLALLFWQDHGHLLLRKRPGLKVTAVLLEIAVQGEGQ